MSAKYKSPSFLLPNELNTSANTANDTGVNSLYSMDFDGSSDFIDCGDNFSFGNVTTDSPFSISAWINMDDATRFRIASKFDSSSNSEYIFTVGGSDLLTVNLYDNSENAYIGKKYNTALTSYQGQWIHVVATYDGTSSSSGIKLYLNSSRVDDIDNNSGTYVAMENTTQSFYIGQQAGSYADGKIDEVAIFNRALNTTEISALYDGTGSNIRPSNLMASNLNPLAYYPLGEQAQMQGYLGNEASSEWQFPNGVLQDYVMDFDGVNDFVDLGDLQPSTTSLSISAWAYKTDTSNASIIGRGASVDYGIFVYGGNLQFGLNAGGWTTISTTLPTLNKWFHVLATWNGSIMKLSVNGGTPVTTSKTGTITYTSNNTTIGKNSTLSGFEWDGKMSNLAIWNSDQSANIANIYNNGSPQTSYTVTPQNWWKLNADSVYTPSAPNYTTALKLDVSSNDNINFTQGLLNNLSEFSISFWYNRLAANDWPSYSIILTQSGLLDIGQFRYENNNAGIAVSLTTANGTFTIPSTGSGQIFLNEWLFVTVVYDGANLISYRNGELAPGTNTVAATGNTVTNTNNFKLEPLYGLEYLASNLAFYNSALTPSQVSTLFNFGTPETNISFSPISWWKLDNLTTGLLDSGSASNNGTNNGATDATTSVAVVPSWKIPNALPIPTINTTSALDFTSGNKISLNPKFNFDLTSVNTISVWVNLKSYSAFNSILTNNGTGGGSTGTYTQLLILTTGSVNNTFAFYTYKQGFSNPTANSGWRSNDIPKQEFENSWHHVMLVRDGQDVSWYYDGQPWGGGTITTTQTENVDVNCIGQGNASSGGLYGEISNLAIWNSDQSSNVSNIYNSGQPQSSYTVTPNHLFKLDNLTTGINDVYSSSAGTATSGVTKVDTDVYVGNIPVNGVSTTLPSTALQQSDLQFDSPYSNYSLYFDGTTGIQCGDIPQLNSATKLSFNVWVNYENMIQRVIFSKEDSTNAIRLYNWTSGVLYFWLKNSGTGTVSYVSNFSSLVNLNEWNMLTVVYDGSQASNNDRVKIFLNGGNSNILTNYGTIPTSTGNITDSFAIGEYSSGAGNKFLGKLDETAIFNTELTSAQILEIYNNGRPKDLSTFSGTAPISWWRLGENAYFQDSTLVLPNSITGAPNGNAATNNLEMISADAPGTYANGIGTNLDILDRVGDAALSTSNSQSYNMIPSDISPYVPQYVGNQIANNFSMTFNGVDDYFNTGSNTIGQLQVLSVSAWFKETQNAVINTALVANNGSTNKGWIIWIDGSNMRWQVADGSSSASWTNTVVGSFRTYAPLNDWNHVCCTFDGVYSKIYINSVLRETWTATPTPYVVDYSGNVGNLTIGRRSYANSGFFRGQIDEVAIFDKALNAGQIYNDIYQPTATGTNQTADLVNNPNLPNPVAWYRMGD